MIKKINSDEAFKYLALLPLLFMIILFAVYPLWNLIQMSFSEVEFSSGNTVNHFVGLKNYRNLLGDEIFLVTMRNTFIYVIVSVIVELTLGLLLSLCINGIARGSIVYRTILLLPFLIPPVVNGTMWKLILNAQFGLLNKILLFFGFHAQNILSSEKTALAGIMIVTVWQWVGYNMLILYAGLQTIPSSIIEAAEIDGAGKVRMLFQITIPLLKPILFVAVIFRMIHAFKGFDLFYVLTGGGPGNSTEIINTYIQKVFMTQQRMGYGSALSIITITVILILFFLFQNLLNKRGET